MAITKVALAGGTGNLGPSILHQLLNAGFQVTVLTRNGSDHTFPASVTAVTVDYSSIQSLTDALQGQDAVVSTLASAALDRQLLLVEAASKAGVKRFIPSEFGSNTPHHKTSKLPSFGPKVAVQEALKKVAQDSNMTYTIVCSGPFLDWGLKVGFVADPKNNSIVLYDGGHREFSTTTLSTIGKAVAGVLKNPDATKNRPVYVQDTSFTLKQLAEIGERVTGKEWKQEVVNTQVLVAQGWDELKKEKPDPGVFVMKFIIASLWGEGYGSHFENLDNDLLGIKQMSNADLENLVGSLAG